MTVNQRPLSSPCPGSSSVPGLVHGFGDARWSEADFLAFAAAKGLASRHHASAPFGRRAPAGRGRPPAKLEGDALMTNVPGLAPRRPHGRLPARSPRRRGEPGGGRRPLRLARHGERASWRRPSRPWAKPTARSRGPAGRSRPLHRRRLLRGRARGPGRRLYLAGRAFPGRPVLRREAGTRTRGPCPRPEAQVSPRPAGAANLWLLRRPGFQEGERLRRRPGLHPLRAAPALLPPQLRRPPPDVQFRRPHRDAKSAMALNILMCCRGGDR
ncbi:MAG: hypothetical protein MZU79_04190 [Anaerotruncus sp.]|nr:hypothetical protein [Anaerotruncus sp.]